MCRRWRQIVFASPHRLDLRILCTSKTPVGKNLGIWPALPLSVDFNYHFDWRDFGNASNEDNIIAALEHFDRIREVRLLVTGSELDKITTAMQEPFPVLASLHIVSSDFNAPALPTKFSGRSAPGLQEIVLFRIPFPELPTFLLSTSCLVRLVLGDIPPSGYISPQAMAVGLATLPRLKLFIIGFRSALPRPDRIHSPPVTRTVLPALTFFHFKGASEYLEDLVTGIDAPQLKQISIEYLNQLIDLQVTQLHKFINSSLGLKLTVFKHANITFYRNRVTFNTSRHSNFQQADPFPPTTTTILCEGIDWQISHIAHVISQFSATLSNLVDLKLKVETEWVGPIEGMGDVDWRHLFQFASVKTLHVSPELAGHVALALEHMVAGELPSIDTILLEGQLASSIGKFVATRKLLGRPVTVVDTEAEFDERVKSYVCK